jgi:hypothetical protein
VKPSLETEMAAIVSTIRPDYADDIDARVAALVNAGEIALDVETDTYRTTRYKYLRFSGSQS